MGGTCSVSEKQHFLEKASEMTFEHVGDNLYDDPHIFSFAVGALRVSMLYDGDLSYSVDEVFERIPDERHSVAACDSSCQTCYSKDDHLTISSTCMLVQDAEGHNILVDGGSGIAYGILERLKQLSISPSGISMIVITTASNEHIGGLLDANGELVFPNARHVISALEWRYWKDMETSASTNSSQLRTRQLFAKLRASKQLDLKDLGEEEQEIAPGVSLFHTPGPTVGHVSVSVRSNGKEILAMGDLLLHMDQMRHKEWSCPQYDDPSQASDSLYKVLTRAHHNHSFVYGYRLPFPSVGCVSLLPPSSPSASNRQALCSCSYTMRYPDVPTHCQCNLYELTLAPPTATHPSSCAVEAIDDTPSLSFASTSADTIRCAWMDAKNEKAATVASSFTQPLDLPSAIEVQVCSEPDFEEFTLSDMSDSEPASESPLPMVPSCGSDHELNVYYADELVRQHIHIPSF
eukprot:GILK01005806.1.p1 GENE.GILK01005806.1~~GILK01005806.1.p1  ORF type:complete len:462 (+),score=37.21 GILK01005806.1:109-1494(+)